MSSKFLSGNANTDIINLLNSGTQTLNVSSIIDQGLVPNLPVCANGMKQLIGRQIGVADINFSVITNPLSSDLNANSHNITNVVSLSGTVNTRNANDIVSNTSTFTSGNVVTGNTGKTIQDSGVALSSLPTTSVLVNGNLVSASGASSLQNSGIVAANVITDSTNLVSGNLPSANGNKTITDSGIIAANVITDTGTLTSGNVVTGSGGKTIQDSGTALSSLATNASLANYLPLAGGTMSGNIDMKSNTITVNSMSDNGTSGIIWGNGSTNPIPAGSIEIGDTITIVGSIDTCVIGRNSNSFGDHSTLLGIFNNSSSGAPHGMCVGFGNSASGDSVICVGTGNQAAATNAVCIGVGLTNSTANSFLIGSAAVGQNFANIRPQTDNTGDLGTTTNRFRNLYLAGVLDNTSSLSIGTTSQTSMTIGRSGVTTTLSGTNITTNLDSSSTLSLGASTATTVNVGNSAGVMNILGSPLGIDSNGTITIGPNNATNVFLGRSGQNVSSQGTFNTTIPYGSWYCSNAYTPSFTAATIILIPPTTSVTTGTLSQFTYASGVLTYTGTRTRVFNVTCNLTFNSGTNNLTMLTFISVNGSTTLPLARSRAACRITATNVDFGCCLSDSISLNTNDTIQLAASSTLTSATISISFVGFSVRGLLN